MAAGCGRRDTLSMRGSPRSRFPSKQSGGHGCGSFFFKKSRLAPRPNPASANHLAAAIYCFCSCFFPSHKVGNPTHALCIGKAARNGGVEMWLALAAICLLRRKDLARVGSRTLENKPVVRSPQLTGEANGCYYTKC